MFGCTWGSSSDADGWCGSLYLFASLPEQLRGRDVIHFIGNAGALFGMAKGCSGDDDSARMIHAFHTVLAAIVD